MEALPHRRRRPAAVAAAVGLLVAVFATPALAHVYAETDDEPHPGTEVELRFAFHHGCAGQATTELSVRVPDEVEADSLVPVDEDGWEASVEAATVTWAGGEPIPDHVEHSFDLHLVLPPTPGETVHFPTIQRCGDDEIAWIQIPEAGESWSELAEPAPALTLTDRPPPGPNPEETAPAVEGTPPSPALEQPEGDGVGNDREAIVAGDEANPWIVAAAIAGVVLLAGLVTGGILLARRGTG